MKTTVEISDTLFKAAKRYATAHEMTFRQVVETGLRTVVKENGAKKPFRLRDASFKGTSLKDKGLVKDYTWPEVRAMIYEGRGG